MEIGTMANYCEAGTSMRTQPLEEMLYSCVHQVLGLTITYRVAREAGFHQAPKTCWLYQGMLGNERVGLLDKVASTCDVLLQGCMNINWGQTGTAQFRGSDCTLQRRADEEIGTKVT